MNGNLVITGALGFLGREVLRHLLCQAGERPLVLIVRAASDDEAHQRVKKTVASLVPSTSLHASLARLRVIRGDLSEANFGIGDSEFSSLARTTSQIFHCAASTDLAGSLPALRRANVASTQHVVDLAVAAQLSGCFQRLDHVSTAFVAGAARETVSAEHIATDDQFRNHYERSKAEAEHIVRSLDGRADFTIYRPSIIIGNSDTGYTSAFNVIYVPAKLLARGLLKVLPALPHVPFDLVPVNFVAKAIASFLEDRQHSERAYHLCAGVGRETTPSEVLGHMVDALNAYCRNGDRPHITPALLHPDIALKLSSSLHVAKETMRHLEEFVSRQLRVLRQIVPFLPYMLSNPRFDTANTDRALSGRVAPAPLFSSYADRVFKYCLDTDWGRVPVRSASSL